VGDELAGLRAFVLDHHIATIPSDLLPKVEETPGFRRATTSAALDPPGPLERCATQAFYYVTPPDAGLAPDKLEQYLEAYYFPGLVITSVHEVWPGHFLQYLTRRAHPDWSLARQMANSYSTREGWAHYAEQMMVEQGLGDGDPKLKIGQIEKALLRDCRFIASIEMHTKGKSVDDHADLHEGMWIAGARGSPRSFTRDEGSWLHQLHGRQARNLEIARRLPREDGR
jgi:hypothetical protein